jgi:hypothetical protein
MLGSTHVTTLALGLEVNSSGTLLDFLRANTNLEALVIRNAGGRAVDAFRSLEVMGTIGPIDLIVVVHHTGMYQ